MRRGADSGGGCCGDRCVAGRDRRNEIPVSCSDPLRRDPPLRLLLIEDSERLRLALKEGLSRSGFAVDTVADGAKGLSYARNNPYDVVILDLGLPGLDGMSLLRSIRKEGVDTHV